jgi:CBS domain containing-hemolysin-like protein
VLKPGEVVKNDGLLFHVERVEKRRVMRVRLQLLDAAEIGQPVPASNNTSRD